jgi:hypothetical protein
MLLSLVVAMMAATTTIASAAITQSSRVNWPGTDWTCAVRAATPIPTGNGHGLRHSDGFASCLKGGVAIGVAHITVITCLQTAVAGHGWRSLGCSTAINATGAAATDATVTQGCGSGYHRLRTQVTATALQPTLTMVAKYATATSDVIGCQGS